MGVAVSVLSADKQRKPRRMVGRGDVIASYGLTVVVVFAAAAWLALVL